MSLLEALDATWDKRFKQRHYSYRDSYPNPLDVTQLGTTVVTTAIGELLLFAAESLLPNGPWTVYYPFGYNARNWTTGIAALTNAGVVGSRFSWPHLGDYASGTVAPRGQCYARNVMVYVTEDTWIRFISLNPIYLTLIAQGYTTAQIAAMGVSQFVTQVEHFVAQNDKDSFFPTYATVIVYRADSIAGTIYISAEGNVEGGE